MKTTTAKTMRGLAILLIVCSNYLVNAQSLSDIDGNCYKTVKYGLQEWIAGNLNVSHFKNGDSIPESRTNDEWVKAGSEGKPAWCYFNNDPENGKMYGKLYNWYALNDPRGLAPENWEIPESRDWSKLVKNLLGIDVAGLKLKSKTGWKSKNGTNKIGFSALPGGYRNEKGEFKEMGAKCQYWANTVPVSVKKSNQIYSFVLNDFSAEAGYHKVEKEVGLSVRCMKDIMPMKVPAADSLSSF